MNPRKIYLWICAVGLIPVALSYGVAPEQSLNWLFGLSVEIPNEIHIFRAVMGLYLGMVALWIRRCSSTRLRRVEEHLRIPTAGGT